jgi:hypothetical protein
MGCAISGINNTQESSTQAKNQYSGAKVSPAYVQKIACNLIDLEKNHFISKSNGRTADIESPKTNVAQESNDQSMLSQPQPSDADPKNDFKNESESILEVSGEKTDYQCVRKLGKHSIDVNVLFNTSEKKSKRHSKIHKSRKNNFKIKTGLQREIANQISPSRDHTPSESGSIDYESIEGYSASNFSVKPPSEVMPIVGIPDMNSETRCEKGPLEMNTLGYITNSCPLFKGSSGRSNNFAPCWRELSRFKPLAVVQEASPAFKFVRRFACFKIRTGTQGKFTPISQDLALNNIQYPKNVLHQAQSLRKLKITHIKEALQAPIPKRIRFSTHVASQNFFVEPRDEKQVDPPLNESFFQTQNSPENVLDQSNATACFADSIRSIKVKRKETKIAYDCFTAPKKISFKNIR